MLSYLNYYLSLAHLSAGDLEDARECAKEALKLSEEHDAKLFECFSLVALRRIEGEADSSQIEIAERSIRQSISLANEMMKSRLPHNAPCFFTVRRNNLKRRVMLGILI